MPRSSSASWPLAEPARTTTTSSSATSRTLWPGSGRSASSRSASTWTTRTGGKRARLVREKGLPLGGLLHHVSFTRAGGAFTAQDQERAGLLAKRLGLTVELAG